MKYFTLLAFSLCIVFSSCGDDEPQPANELGYAGDNVDSPLLPAGDFKMAVMFPASTMNDHIGKFLEEVDYRMYDVPQVLEMKIYEGGNGSEPGALVYTSNLSNSAAANVFNTAFLNPPLEITGDDLWISFEFTQFDQQKTIGCDGGPAATNGNWFIESTSPDGWIPFDEILDDVNWNITGILSE